MQQRLRGLFTHARHARNVIRGVAHQREEVNNQLRRHAVFGHHFVRAENGIGHGIDKRNARGDKLRHIFIPGADKHRAARFFRFTRQRTDHVIRFHAGDG